MTYLDLILIGIVVMFLPLIVSFFSPILSFIGLFIIGFGVAGLILGYLVSSNGQTFIEWLTGKINPVKKQQPKKIIVRQIPPRTNTKVTHQPRDPRDPREARDPRDKVDLPAQTLYIPFPDPVKLSHEELSKRGWVYPPTELTSTYSVFFE